MAPLSSRVWASGPQLAMLFPRLHNLWEVASCWRKRITGGQLWEFAALHHSLFTISLLWDCSGGGPQLFAPAAAAVYPPPLWTASGILRQNKAWSCYLCLVVVLCSSKRKVTDKAGEVRVWQTPVFHILPGSTTPFPGKPLIKQWTESVATEEYTGPNLRSLNRQATKTSTLC